jgi:hypothetical protein
MGNLAHFSNDGSRSRSGVERSKTVTLSTGSQDMRTRSYTHSQSHKLAEVGDMEDVRSVSGFRGGDGREIRIADMQEIGYVSVIRSVEGSEKRRFRRRKVHCYWSRTDEKFTPTGPVTSRSEFYTALLMPTNWELSTARRAARADRS